MQHQVRECAGFSANDQRMPRRHDAVMLRWFGGEGGALGPKLRQWFDGRQTMARA